MELETRFKLSGALDCATAVFASISLLLATTPEAKGCYALGIVATGFAFLLTQRAAEAGALLVYAGVARVVQLGLLVAGALATSAGSA